MRLLLLSREAEWRFVGWWSLGEIQGGWVLGRARQCNHSERGEGGVEVSLELYMNREKERQSAISIFMFCCERRCLVMGDAWREGELGRTNGIVAGED
jgi:hypothetical protein